MRETSNKQAAIANILRVSKFKKLILIIEILLQINFLNGSLWQYIMNLNQNIIKKLAN